MQLALGEAMERHLPRERLDLKLGVQAWLFAGAAPLIAPSWRLAYKACSVIEAGSGVHSGEKLTAIEDTIFSLAAELTALHRQGFDAKAWPSQHDFATWNAGDDTRLERRPGRPLSAEAFSDTFTELGLRVKLTEGISFLSKYEGQVNGQMWSGVPIAARCVQQTLQNENESPGAWGRLTAPLGFVSRFQLSEAWPLRLQDVVWSCVREAEWLAEAGISQASSLADARIACDARAAEAMNEIIKRGEQSQVRIGEWVSSLLRSTDHSLFAETLLARFPALRNTADPILAAEDAFARIQERVLLMDEGTRLKAAIEGSKLLVKPKSVQWTWLMTLAADAGIETDSAAALLRYAATSGQITEEELEDHHADLASPTEEATQ
jgi:hypothetical protein